MEPGSRGGPGGVTEDAGIIELAFNPCEIRLEEESEHGRYHLYVRDVHAHSSNELARMKAAGERIALEIREFFHGE